MKDESQWCTLQESTDNDWQQEEEKTDFRDDDPDKGLSWEGTEDYEYECGNYCTEDGCQGHHTDIPLSMTINGVTFWVEGAESGDFPGPNKEWVRHVDKVVRAVGDLIVSSYTKEEVSIPEGCTSEWTSPEGVTFKIDDIFMYEEKIGERRIPSLVRKIRVEDKASARIWVRILQLKEDVEVPYTSLFPCQSGLKAPKVTSS